MTGEPQAVFVYGTLRRGGKLAHLWPLPPQTLAPARVRGALFDLGPYPALAPGEDWISGERWTFAAAEMPVVLARLDRVEGFAQQADDLYRREVVLTTGEDGAQAPAYAYFYARSLASARRIEPDALGLCRWEAK